MSSLASTDSGMAGRRLVSQVELDGIVARFLVFLLPLQSLQVIGRSFDVGVLLAAALSPVIIPQVLASRPHRRLFFLLIFSSAFGIVLLEFAVDRGAAIDRGYGEAIIGLVVGSAFALATFTWATNLMSLPMVAVIYACGCVADGLMDQSLWQDNAWKFAFGWPTAVIALGLVYRLAAPFQLLVLAGIGITSIAHDYRSLFGFCLVCAVIVIVNVLRRHPELRSRRHVLAGFLVLVIVAGGVYEVGTKLAIEGALGPQTQQRTEQKVRSGRSLIAVGRPEGAATIALARERPIGYGPGVSAAPEELGAAKRALMGRGVAPDSEYVTKYMFADHIEVHSVWGDMWVNFGLVGFAAGLYMLTKLGRGVAYYLGAPSPLFVFLGVAALWDMLFSPLPSNLFNAVLAFTVLAWEPFVDRAQSPDDSRAGLLP